MKNPKIFFIKMEIRKLTEELKIFFETNRTNDEIAKTSK